MIDRQQELAVLEEAYQKNTFQFLAVYGHHYVGKTTLLQEFAKKHYSILFSAQEKNDVLNLMSFSRVVQEYFIGYLSTPFSDWRMAFTYIGNHADEEQRIVVIIDDFHSLVGQRPSIENTLKHAIDNEWEGKNIFLILCFPDGSFIEHKGVSVPHALYNRLTGKLEVKPFDYLDGATFFPHYSPQEKLVAYGILGGIPRHLAAFDDTRSIEDNVIEKILSPNAFLHDELQMILRLHLRDLAVYNSILESIANGDNRVTTIARRIHESRNKCGMYLQTLQNIYLIKKIVRRVSIFYRIFIIPFGTVLSFRGKTIMT